MKLDVKHNGTQWLTEASRLMGLAPVFSMMCAMIMVVLSVHSVIDVIRVAGLERKSQDLPEFSLKSIPVGEVVYEEYAQVLSKLSPDVKVLGSRDGIKIDIADSSKYAEFMYVLNSVQGLSKDVIWHAEEICLAGCSGQGSQALVKGTTEKVEVKLRGQSNE